MEELDRRTASHLVFTSGFSRRNAEIAMQMYHEDELTEIEKEVITKIRLDPENDNISIKYTQEVGGPRIYVLDHLNHRITNEHGGDAKTPHRKRRQWA